MRSSYDPSAVRSGAVFSDNPNYAAAWVCYINGIETPILGFNISTGVWQPPQFEIHVAPDVTLQGLGQEDRVPVVLFYLDPWNNPEHPEPRLLVDGEIRGYRSRRSNGQRMMSFICMSHINVFEKLYFFFMNTVDDIVAAQSPEIRSQGFTGQGLFYPYSLFHQGLFVNQGAGADREVDNDAPDAAPSGGQGAIVKTAHEIHYNVIKGIIASAPTVPDDKRSLPMMNFFARHTRKTRLHQRFVRLPILEDVATVNARKGVFPIFAAVRADEALTAMQHQVAGRIGNSGSIWDMLKQIYGLVYMEFAAIPNPSAVRTNLEGEILGPVSAGDTLIEQRPAMSPPTAITSRTPTATATSSIGSSPATPIRLAQFFAKPQFFFGVPPHCNVFFPSMIDDLTYGADYGEKPTRIYVNDSVMGRVLRASGPNREFMLHALTVAHPEEADAVMHSNVPDGETPTGSLHTTGKNLLIWPEEFYKGPVSAKMELPSWFQTMMQFLNASEGGGDSGATVPAVNAAGPAAPTISPAARAARPIVTIPERGRLSNRTYLPDSWIIPEGVIAAAQQQPAIRRDIGEVDLVDRQVLAPTAAIRALGRHIQQLFPGLLSSNPEYRRPRDRAHGSKNDLHLYGRAVDFPVRMIRGQVNHTNGDVIANWLIQHAAEYGIQFLVWATTQWSGSRQQGTVRHAPYYLREGTNTALHRDHIHCEINLDGAHGLTLGYAALGIHATPLTAPLPVAPRRRRERAEPAVSGELSTDRDQRATLGATPQRQVTRVTTGEVTPPGSVPAGGTAGRGASATVPTSTVATSTPRTPSAEGAELPPNQKFAEIFRIYAQAEYLRQRYTLNNGAVTLKFNPYVVAGFPCVAFDRATTSEHIVGYIYTVNHAAMGNSIGTSVGLTCVRTLPEFLNDVRNDCERFAERVVAAPAEMIPEVRRVIQDEGQSEIFYQRLFYGGARPGNLPAAFHFDRAIGYTRGLNVEAISIQGTEREVTEGVAPATLNDANAILHRMRNNQTTARAGERLTSAPGVTNESALDLAGVYAELERLERNAQAEQVIGAGPRTPSSVPAPSPVPPTTQGVEDAVRRLRRLENLETTQSSGGRAAPERTVERTVTHNIDPNESLTPLPGTIYTDAFDNHHIAMQLAARNVCTLTEYIRFWHGGRALGDLLSSGDVEGVESDYAYGTVVESDVVAEGVGANGERRVTVGQATRYTGTFYRRIYKLRTGPGAPPNERERGYTTEGTPAAATSGVSADYPQTRADWDSVLLAYREKIRTRVAPST